LTGSIIGIGDSGGAFDGFGEAVIVIPGIGGVSGDREKISVLIVSIHSCANSGGSMRIGVRGAGVSGVGVRDSILVDNVADRVIGIGLGVVGTVGGIGDSGREKTVERVIGVIGSFS